ncbi:MAG: EthD family reductase [Pseudomonadota bacterium]
MKYICIVILTLIFAQTGITFSAAEELNVTHSDTETEAERIINLYVLYPHPENTEVFDLEYKGHAQLIKERTGKPFIVSKILGNDQGSPGFYQMFTMSFSSMEELSSVLTPAIKEELDADAVRISTGGKPLILVSEVEKYN